MAEVRIYIHSSYEQMCIHTHCTHSAVKELRSKMKVVAEIGDHKSALMKNYSNVCIYTYIYYILYIYTYKCMYTCKNKYVLECQLRSGGWSITGIVNNICRQDDIEGQAGRVEEQCCRRNAKFVRHVVG